MATMSKRELQATIKYSIGLVDPAAVSDMADKTYLSIDFDCDLDAGCAYTKLVDAIAIAKNNDDRKALVGAANCIVLSRGAEFESTHPYRRSR